MVEFIHTATLVHDDIIDDADLRRGRAAVHSRWGNDITVLLGDYLYIKSMAMALTHDELAIIHKLCDITLHMIEGELYRLTKNGDTGITEEEHFDIIAARRPSCFGGCAQSAACSPRCRRAGPGAGIRLQSGHGVSAGGRSARFRRRCRRGRQADSQRSARRQGHVAAHPPAGARHRRPQFAQIIRDIIATRNATPEQWHELQRCLKEHASIDYTYPPGGVRASPRRAKKPLYAFPPSAERDALLAVARFRVLPGPVKC